jgi:prepilin-type N-terminal cleavage/methylation domain-containing protein
MAPAELLLKEIFMEPSCKESKKQDGDAGFTIVEVIVAMSCFLIIALALGTLSLNSWGAVTHSRLTTDASVVGSRTIEGMISRVYHDAAIVNGTHAASDNIFSISYTIGDDALLPDCKYVLMNVSYNAGGKTKNIRYHYILPERVQ